MIDIAKATSDDLTSIRLVQRQTWLATYPNTKLGITREDIEAKFALGESFIGKHAWVAKIDGAVVAYITAKKERTQNRILALYVLPRFQHQGIGKKLFSVVRVWMGTAKHICINVAAYNENAIGFYETLGFTKTGKSITDETAILSKSKIIPEIEMTRRSSVL